VTEETRAGNPFDVQANPKVLATIRAGVGVIALLKGLVLVALSTPPAAVMLPWFALAFAVAIGWHARPAAAGLVALAAILLSGGHYSNHLYLLTLVLALVALSDCERAHAVRVRGAGPVPGWPLLLMRAQLSIVYVFAGIAKLNAEFLSGETMGHLFANAVLPAPALPSLVLVLSWATVAAEIFVGLAVWSERLRPWAFALVLPLHAVMPLVAPDAMQLAGIAIFALLMLVLFASFQDVPERERLVIWDDESDAWRRRIAVIRRLDLFGALRFARRSDERRYRAIGGRPGETDSSLHVFLPGWRIKAGVAALREILDVLPGGCLLAPYLGLPAAEVAGRRLGASPGATLSSRPSEPSARPV
jgi:hypothetical protein